MEEEENRTEGNEGNLGGGNRREGKGLGDKIMKVKENERRHGKGKTPMKRKEKEI